MGERVSQIAKVPEVKQSNSNFRVRRTERLQSMDTPVDRILYLQRTVGNQAVSRLMKSGAVQEKLRIGQPGDVYEQEADRVADEVMRMPEPRMHRQVETEDEEEETLQSKPLANQITPLVRVQQNQDRLAKSDLGAIRAQRNDKQLFVMREEGDEKTAAPKPKINYKSAKRRNTYYAGKNILGWESKLVEVAGGAYKGWVDLWKEGKYDEFADAVAVHQVKFGWSGKDVDGVLGLKTWAQIAGLGEAMAGIRRVRWEDSEGVCTQATKERIRRGHKIATGKSLTFSEDKTMNIFDAIIHSVPKRMLDVELKYRGTGAAGALAYVGLGEFVPEADIWAGKLKPGAAIQVWGDKDAYDILRMGEIEKNGKKRRITDTDANFYGTSFVFVRYDTESFERMLVRHYGFLDWMSKGSYAVWVAANAKSAEEAKE